MLRRLKMIGIGVAIAVGFGLYPHAAAKAASPPSIQASYAVVINAKNGEVLYDKQSHHQAYPASITKLMTVLLMEKYMSNDDFITASSHAVAQDASNWFYRMHVGEKMSKEDAINALMIISSNDVAMAVAEHIGGSEAGFAKLMNQEAKSLGLKDTHFVTPNGLHNPKHYTTPYDMAIIAKEVMKYPDLLKAMQQSTYIIHTDQQTAEIYRRDKIYDNPLAFGGKTGFTDQAEQTIVEYERSGSKDIIAVVMHDNNAGEYPDVLSISHFAFNQIKTHTFGSKGDVYQTIKVNGQSLPVTLASQAEMQFKDGDVTSSSVKWKDLDNFKDGVSKGYSIGTLALTLNGKVVKKVNLLAAKSISASVATNQMDEKVTSRPIWLWTERLAVVGLLVLGYFVLKPGGLKRKPFVDQQQSD
ncbi:D-alanyl-D-alanine carboxypeptidase [Pullulanibacillus sp. KACC 23026]|uniref:D-alanyl-D-alanine carboxypeptidase family protein n=1 Tax=Pullulanibacillus sp. KACC 23026 TaxID=3028315 RepID=UPI0023B1D0A3|nr:D-alanyl-D-alanine carboxypeptidase family protein [Pullulanibacillus sp. KACC 23026]WEG14349.1 D-alanyl-D-alanine carboxypeptidase [Pullulanibacillus sp. KACC 23026]